MPVRVSSACNWLTSLPSPSFPHSQGARLVAVMMLSFITPLSMLPLTAHLLLQLYAVLMVSWRLTCHGNRAALPLAVGATQGPDLGACLHYNCGLCCLPCNSG